MIKDYINRLIFPKGGSHKGQNGKLLIIGGSELFHAPLLWAAETASKIVDMVHVTSATAVNNRLMQEKLKHKFWNGIVVGWENVEDYIQEDEVVLIGPGMMRSSQTTEITNALIGKYPTKKWVIDGGGLQMVDADLLRGAMIITPHHKEWERFNFEPIQFSKIHNNVVVLLKGEVDRVVRGGTEVIIEGGNSGMTKGGTGDVLAGLVAALATKNDLLVSAVVASWVNKRAGDRLYGRVGSYFNATELMQEIPHVMHEIIQQKSLI
jgi:NAD(P)H-hydrate epimerase